MPTLSTYRIAVSLLAASLTVAGGSQLQPVEAAASSANPLTIAQSTLEPTPEFDTQFKAVDAEGSILIYDLTHNQTYQHNSERNATAFSPASTFKIPNSLIAIETGVIDDELAILTWDGVERSYPVWNRDLNLREAFKISAVWFYQVLARRVGYEQMQQWVAQMGYGNQSLGSADNIDSFWLRGEFKITPQEQVQFLQRLYTEELPFSARTFNIVKDIMIAEQTPDYTLRAKTGWALAEQVGWYVGYLEQGGNVYFFATNIEMQDETDLPKRQAVTRLCLEQLGLL